MIRITKTHDSLMEACIDEFNGTPEEFGALVCDATLRIDSWLQGDARKEWLSKKQNAIKQIEALPSGKAYLIEERKFLNRI